MGLLKLGKVSLDGTKIKANASKHHALSWGHACKLEQQLQAEVEELIRLAEQADTARIPDGMDIPKEIPLTHADKSLTNLIADARMKASSQASRNRLKRQISSVYWNGVDKMRGENSISEILRKLNQRGVIAKRGLPKDIFHAD